VIRREKEEELVFRGLQYAEAIRVFKNRFQREPIRLQELIEVEPRSIRKLWKDPMTEDGKWALIPVQGPVMPTEINPTLPGDERKGQGKGKDDKQKGGEDSESGEQEGGFGVPGQGGEVQIGPLKGVHSKSKKTSFLLFNGKDHYDEWWFTEDLLNQGQGMNGPGGNPVGPLQMSTRWIGRPIPEFLLPRQGTGLPDGQNSQPGGLPVSGGPGGGKGGRPRSGSGKPSN